jgi:hypothetical protein
MNNTNNVKVRMREFWKKVKTWYPTEEEAEKAVKEFSFLIGKEIYCPNSPPYSPQHKALIKGFMLAKSRKRVLLSIQVKCDSNDHLFYLVLSHEKWRILE